MSDPLPAVPATQAAPSAPLPAEPEADLEAEHESPHEARLITVIGIFKGIKGTLLLLAALGTFKLLGKDLDDVVDQVQAFFHLDMDGRLVQWLYLKADDLTDGVLKTIAGVGTTYGLLLCTESYGLIRRRKWAELLVIVATMIPVPVELYELFHEFKVSKLVLLAFNLAIVGYLYRRRQQFLTREQVKAAKAAKRAAKAAAAAQPSPASPAT